MAFRSRHWSCSLLLIGCAGVLSIGCANGEGADDIQRSSGNPDASTGSPGATGGVSSGSTGGGATSTGVRTTTGGGATTAGGATTSGATASTTGGSGSASTAGSTASTSGGSGTTGASSTTAGTGTAGATTSGATTSSSSSGTGGTGGTGGRTSGSSTGSAATGSSGATSSGTSTSGGSTSATSTSGSASSDGGGAATGGGESDAAAGAELFFDNFEDGNANGWTPAIAGTDFSVATDQDADGSTTHVYEQGTVSSSSTVYVSIAGDRSWTDVAVEARVKITSQIAGSSSDWAAVFARAIDQNNFYAITLRGDGKLAFRKKVTGSSTSIGSTFTVTPAVTTGAWYTVKLVVKGDTLTAYFQGNEVGTITDGDLTSGGIGVGSSKASAEFDDVRATTP